MGLPLWDIQDREYFVNVLNMERQDSQTRRNYRAVQNGEASSVTESALELSTRGRGDPGTVGTWAFWASFALLDVSPASISGGLNERVVDQPFQGP